MRISDWSSDVCSSDLGEERLWHPLPPAQPAARPVPSRAELGRRPEAQRPDDPGYGGGGADRRPQRRFPVRQAGNLDAAERRPDPLPVATRSEEHTSELQSLMRISYAGFCLKKKNTPPQ